MSNLTDFFPSGGGGLTPKFQEFNSSGTFTPTQALIDAGGYIEVFLVAGGGGGSNYQNGNPGGYGGEVKIKKMNLNSLSAISVAIGSGGGQGQYYGNNGGNSVFNGSSAGGVDVTCNGGKGGGSNAWASNANPSLSPNWPSRPGNYSSSAGNGVFGYGAGGASNEGTNTQSYGGSGTGSNGSAYANSGQGGISATGSYHTSGGSGYCLIKWYE